MKDKLPELRGSRGQKDRAIIHQKKSRLYGGGTDLQNRKVQF